MFVSLQLQQFESHPFFAQFVTQMADRMQPILKQAHEAASDALSEFQAQADARWSEEQAAMQEFRDSHPAPEGGTIDGSDAPPGTRMFRSAFRAAEALLGRISSCCRPAQPAGDQAELSSQPWAHPMHGYIEMQATCHASTGTGDGTGRSFFG